MSERQPYQTVNTFTRHIQPSQIISYILVVSLFIVFFAAVQGNYQSQTTRIVMIILFTLDFLVVLASCLICSLRDPADPIMLIYRNGKREDVLQYIQQCLYCDTCRSYVHNTSRHCKICNRCVNHFDHHCSWINNCIGYQNYWAFFVMIVATFMYMFLFCLAVGLLFQESKWSSFQNSFIASWIFFTPALIVCVPLLILIILHIYLSYNGLTTFEFIMRKRRESKEEEEKKNELKSEKNKETIISNIQNMTSEELEFNRSRRIEEDVIFQRMNTDQSQNQGRKQFSRPVQVEKSNYTVPLQEKPQRTLAKDNSTDLKEIFRNNRSLKYLIGNDVLIRPNHNPDSFNRQYHTIRAEIKKESENRPNKHGNPIQVRYLSQGPRILNRNK